MKLLIICNPEEGNATELSLFLKAEAEKMNRRVVLLNADTDTRSPKVFDAVIITATIRGRGYDHIITNYLSRFNSDLTALPTLFISVYNCLDENNLTLPIEVENIPSKYLLQVGLIPQRIFQVAVGSNLENNKYVTFADWPKLKLLLQQFLIKNDVMMVA